MGNAFKFGLTEEVASQCHTDDAPELILGDVCAFRELGESDGVVGWDEREDAEL